jgi:hypothetical protein
MKFLSGHRLAMDAAASAALNVAVGLRNIL